MLAEAGGEVRHIPEADGVGDFADIAFVALEQGSGALEPGLAQQLAGGLVELGLHVAVQRAAILVHGPSQRFDVERLIGQVRVNHVEQPGGKFRRDRIGFQVLLRHRRADLQSLQQKYSCAGNTVSVARERPAEREHWP